MTKTKWIVKYVGIVLILGLQVSAQGASKALRVAEISPLLWTQFNKGEIKDLAIEFRLGDRLPVNLQAEGDLFETSEVNASYLVVKRSFWLRVEQNDMLMSLDGTTYKQVKDLVTGSITAGAGSDEQNGIANSINLVFKTILK